MWGLIRRAKHIYYKKRNIKSRDSEEYYMVLQRKAIDLSTKRGAEVVIATEKLMKRIQAKIAKAEKKAKQYKEEVGKLVKDRNLKKKETRPKAERKLENAKKRKEALEAMDLEDRILAENDTNDDTIIETVLDKTRDI
ncbi:hypothetical protein EG327_000170 [Venturia inaequalis]|uniref:Uncharacterized protein n=1 Tax=Venturia inaequalis TaxID=5025 RepID=A0A8H3UAW5_VENIN|nr:hypothetical protein EG327_000170 [Venturia inaequalis]